MKKIIGLFLISAIACTNQPELTLSVANPSNENRTNELAELPLEAFAAFQKKAGESFILTDPAGKQIPYQITYDRKVVFPVSVPAGGTLTYTVRPGVPDSVRTVACGDFYPERVDDIAWENDRIAFRTYGPALQASGEKAYGYDVWVKSISEPVVKARYDKELDQTVRAEIAELRKTDPKAADERARSISYHIDHGDGMDFYAVGPTLGAGTSALLINDSIVYPYCYQDYQIMDNGPLRFTVRLTYPPFVAGTDSAVTETRIISLDAGSHLNKTVITYENLHRPVSIVTGLVMHAPSEEYQADAAAGYIAYGDVPQGEDGRVYVAAVIPRSEKLQEARAVYFPEEEKRQRGASGHVQAVGEYRPGAAYTYYWGAGWSRYGFATPEDWYAYVRSYARSVNEPLTVRVR